MFANGPPNHVLTNFKVLTTKKVFQDHLETPIDTKSFSNRQL